MQAEKSNNYRPTRDYQSQKYGRGGSQQQYRDRRGHYNDDYYNEYGQEDYQDKGGYGSRTQSRYQQPRQNQKPATKEQEEPQYSEEYDSESDEESEEEKLTDEQRKFIQEKQYFCSKNLSILKMEEVQRICIDFKFDEEKVDEYLKVYDIEQKYKGLAAYEWHETTTKEQKNAARKMKLLTGLRERNKAELAKKREEERQKKAEERRLEREKRKAERMEQQQFREKQKRKFSQGEAPSTKPVYVAKGGKYRAKQDKEQKSEENKEVEKKEEEVVNEKAPEEAKYRAKEKKYRAKEGGKGVVYRKKEKKVEERKENNENQQPNEQEKVEEKEMKTTSVEVKHVDEGKNEQLKNDEDDDCEDLLRKAANANREQADIGFNSQNQTPVKPDPKPRTEAESHSSQAANKPPQQPQMNINMQFQPTMMAPIFPQANTSGQQWTPEQQQMMFQQFQWQQQLLQQYQHQLYLMQQQLQSASISGGAQSAGFQPNSQMPPMSYPVGLQQPYMMGGQNFYPSQNYFPQNQPNAGEKSDAQNQK